MSFQATAWLCRPGVAESSSEFAILAVLAHHADARGRGAWPSQRTIAEITGCSTRTVRRKLADLERRGTIRRGNQAAVSHLPASVRPVVWDLCMTNSDDRPKEAAPRRPERAPDSVTSPGHPVHQGGTHDPKTPDTSVRQSVKDHPMNSPGDHIREPIARERVKPLPESLQESDLSWTSPDNPRCQEHAALGAHVHRPCGACGAVRREFERRDDAAASIRRATVAERRAAIQACPHCDANGFIQVGPSVVVRCDHQGDAARCGHQHDAAPTPRHVDAPHPSGTSQLPAAAIPAPTSHVASVAPRGVPLLA